MVDTKKRQKFFDVEIPLINKKTQLYGYSIEEMKNRFIIYDLTKILRGKNVLMKFKISEVLKENEKKLIAEPIEANIPISYIRKVIRKGVNYVEDSFSAESKGFVFRVKPLLITRMKVSRKIRKALREKAREEIKNYLKNKNSEEIFKDFLKGKIQKSLIVVLKKIYPLSFCDIRVLKLEK